MGPALGCSPLFNLTWQTRSRATKTHASAANKLFMQSNSSSPESSPGFITSPASWGEPEACCHAVVKHCTEQYQYSVQ